MQRIPVNAKLFLRERIEVLESKIEYVPRESAEVIILKRVRDLCNESAQVTDLQKEKVLEYIDTLAPQSAEKWWMGAFLVAQYINTCRM